MALWYISWSFGYLFPFWYIVPRYLNLATPELASELTAGAQVDSRRLAGGGSKIEDVVVAVVLVAVLGELEGLFDLAELCGWR
jgi:hypothetical protein